MAPSARMIQTLELLTADECAQVATSLDALRPYWEKTSPFGRMYVLGAASYIHASREPAGSRYHERAARLAPVMRAHFGWVYERMLCAIAAAYGGAAVLAEGLGPPGFHIYRWDRARRPQVTSVHCDLQYEAHDFARYGTPDLASPLSFTVAVREPPGGAAMNLWPRTIADARRNPRASFRAELATTPPRRVRYQLGELTLHSGLAFHQIEPFVLAPGEVRVTLQGHAVRCDDTWQVYW